MRTGVRVEHVLDGVAIDSTSNPISIVNATKVSFLFKADVTSGNGVFTVEISPDGEEWIVYNRLISNVENGNTETVTRVGSVTLSTDTSSLVSMSPEDCCQFVRVTLDQTTDGTYDAWVIIQK